MKIVYLTSLYYDYTIQLANSLSKKEEVILMLPNNILKEYLDNINENAGVYLFKYPKHMYNPVMLFTAFEIIEQINMLNPDIIHFQVTGILPCIIPSFLKKYPIIMTFHDIKPHIGSKYRLFFRFIFYCARRNSNQIFVHGQNMKELMIKMYDVPREMVHTIPIGEHEIAPFKKYERDDRKEDENLILFFGRIFKYKGLEYLIKAEPLITKEVPNAKIIIAGMGGDFSRYDELILNKDNFIIFNYFIDYKKGAELFQRCSVVVLPYIDASQSGVIPTAYGFKKPVVVTDVGAIPEIVDDGVTGFIVPPKDREALAEAIVKLLKDEKLRKQMGENAYKKLKTDLSWDKIADKTIEVYKKAINEHKNKRRR